MMRCTLVIAAAAIILADAVSGQPQSPSCGTFEVLEDTMIETRLFRKGTYVFHSIGVPCEEVLGAEGLFAKFLSLGDEVPLPEPWKSLTETVGSPKFATGPGYGFRAQRISD